MSANISSKLAFAIFCGVGNFAKMEGDKKRLMLGGMMELGT